MERLNSTAKKENEQEIRSVVVFDTESTGLPSPGNKPRITELCFLAATREELLTRQRDVRVINKLQLCFNPRKTIGSISSQITGLYNDSLSLMAEFKVQVSLIIDFLRTLPQPTCLVAHNGNGFDFPLLVAELKQAKDQLPQTILCADSLEALRTFDGLSPVPEFILKKREENKKTAQRSPENPGTDEVSEVSENKPVIECKTPKRKPIGSPDTENEMKQQKVSEPWESAQGTPTISRTEEKESYMMKKESKSLSEYTDSASDTRGALESVTRQLFGEKDESHLSETGVETGLKLKHSISSGELPKSDTLTDSEEQIILEVEHVESVIQKEDQVSPLQGDVMKTSPCASAPTEKKHSPCNAEKEQSSKLGSSQIAKEGPAPNVSYSLGKVYSRIFGQEPDVSHTAEGDCRTLLKIMNYKADTFLKWLDKEAVPLREVSPMY